MSTRGHLRRAVAGDCPAVAVLTQMGAASRVALGRAQFLWLGARGEVHPGMLLTRDFITYMARETVRHLVEEGLIETPKREGLTARVRAAMDEELSVEERLNEEVRQILTQYAEQMRKTGASYQEMYKKVKSQLARDRKLILR